MTTLRTLVCFIALLTPLSGEVFAQAEPSATTTASGTLIATPTAAADQAPWFRVERIEGDIDVGDFVVGPGRAEIAMEPGETIVQEITVTNRISDGRVFRLEVEDIEGTSDGSSSVTLSDGERGPYSIKDYISFPEETFTLKLGERARIPVTITIPADAEPGGFYGSVLVSTDRTAEPNPEVTTRSPIIARVGSLFFVTVRGETEIAGEVKSISTKNNAWWYEKGPIGLSILYENTGSVHVNPYGELLVTNMFGEEVGYIELEPWFVLPKSLRNRDLEWDREFLLGRYTVTAKINRGYDDIVDEVSTSFWVLPWKIVGGVFLTVFILVFSIRAFFQTFQFTRKS